MTMSNWHVYYRTAIDIGWERIETVFETMEKMMEEANNVPFNELSYMMARLGEFCQDFSNAQILAKGAGWEGDFRHAPCVFWIPGGDIEMVYGFVWKQNNNGDTIVVSPVEMPWLREDER